MLQSSFRVILLCVTLTLLSQTFPSCNAYNYTILSQTLPLGSYYIESSFSSKALSPFAAMYNKSQLQYTISSDAKSDVIVMAQATGLFAIVSMDPNSADWYCVISASYGKSSTLQQSGLACTIAPNTTYARIQAEPSTDFCGGISGSNPCKESVVKKLQIDVAQPIVGNNNADPTPVPDDNMGSTSSIFIIAGVSGAIGLVALVVVIVMVIRAQRLKHMKNMTNAAKASSTSATVMWADPSAVIATSPVDQRNRGTSTHVRTQTEQNFNVNPALYNVAVDVHEPAVQLSSHQQPYRY